MINSTNRPPKPAMTRDLHRSYGRVQGRKLSPNQERLVASNLPQIAFTPEQLKGKDNVCLEIGFGKGEHLAQYAMRNPDTFFIGCEPFINGVARLLQYIKDDNIENIRIFHGDARMLLESIDNNILDKVFILFPDPWPKVKHHKKRIINDKMLELLAKKLKYNAILEVATDHVDYGDKIAEHLDNSELFQESEITKNKRETPPHDWIPTNYQQKAEKQGRPARFFNFINKFQ